MDRLRDEIRQTIDEAASRWGEKVLTEMSPDGVGADSGELLPPVF